MESNYIAIFDNTMEAAYLYVSDSVTDVLGYSPHELIGKGVYHFIHSDEIHGVHVIHRANVMNERMSVMISYRFLHRDGHYVELDTVVHYCMDSIISTNYLRGQDTVHHKMRASSVDDWYNVKSDGTLHLGHPRKDKDIHLRESLTVGNKWIKNRILHSQEPRFSMILNRFTDMLDIVFISHFAKDIVSINTDDAVGKPLYMFVNKNDAKYVQAQMTLARTNDKVVRLIFDWLVDYDTQHTITVEAVVSCTNDGLVMVVRQAAQLTV
ncbi:hypothetical protein BDF14DRAFT_1143205 [Spinellus fusiger]|nr:hypothetical protein BDF14DRAFT_1143205 [Spinellus fusiger]